MSSGAVHPQAHPLPPGGFPRRHRPPATTADGAGFAVDWEVRPSPPEADTAAAAAAQDPSSPRGDGLSFDIARALGTVVVSLRGRLVEPGSRVLRDVLADLIENQGNLAVVVDLDGVSEVDPGSLDIFVAAHGWAIMRGGQLSLTGAGDRVAAALEASGVVRLVKVTSDRILAVPGPAASLRPGSAEAARRDPTRAGRIAVGSPGRQSCGTPSPPPVG